LTGSFNLLSNVITSAKVFACPSDSAVKLNANYPLSNNAANQNISYAYSIGLIWQDQPDSVIALDRMGGNKGAAVGVGYTKGAKWLTTAVVAPHKDSGGNVLYNDGHVSWNNSLSASAGTTNIPVGSVLIPENNM